MDFQKGDPVIVRYFMGTERIYREGIVVEEMGPHNFMTVNYGGSLGPGGFDKSNVFTEEEGLKLALLGE